MLSQILLISVILALPVQEDQEPKRYATVGRQTTFATGPVDKNGNVDYGRFLNQELGKNIDPKHNAVIDWIRIVGPKVGVTANRELALQLMSELGMDPIPAKGDYFLSWSEYSDKLDDAVFETIINATFDPWTKEKFPEVQQWMELNKKWDARILASLRKTQAYFPPSPSRFEDSKALDVYTFAYWIDGLTSYCSVKLMNEIASARFDTAIDTAQQLDRFGELYTQGLSWWNYVNARNSKRYFFYALRRIAERKVQKSHIRRMRTLLESTNVSIDFQRVVLPHRIEFLDLAKHYAISDPKNIIADFGIDPNTKEQALIMSVVKSNRWDRTLTEANRWYDEIEKILAVQPASKQSTLRHQFQQKLDRFVGDPWSKVTLRKLEKMSADEKSVWITKVLFEYHFPLGDSPGASFDQDYFWSNQGLEAERDMTLLALSLEEYRKDKKRYPDKLKDLVPGYVKVLPIDPFGTGPFKYKIVDGDYRLYSVGYDGKDNGGASFGGSNEFDIVIGCTSDPGYHD